MAARTSVKARRSLPRFVGVISSRDDLRFAIRMRNPPDLFELRLDHLVGIINEVENKLSMLTAPLIITARHRRAGGATILSTKQRSELLSRRVPHARCIDVTPT